MTDYKEVVTRYGGFRHYTDTLYGWKEEYYTRYFTECRGTSSWTIEDWEKNNDHPLGLSIEEMKALPICPRCEAMVNPPKPPEPTKAWCVTYNNNELTAWVFANTIVEAAKAAVVKFGDDVTYIERDEDYDKN